MRYVELKEAIDILSIPPLSTYSEIKQMYKQEVKINHPDRNANPKKSIEDINGAYEVIKEYVEDFRFFFTKEEFDKQYPEESYGRQFRA
ncbi:MAG: J domain-containing protein [Campylobacterales bacterium]